VYNASRLEPIEPKEPKQGEEEEKPKTFEDLFK
jgi:hypothetical protein